MVRPRTTTHTHTFALLQISDAAYREIEQKLREAKYDHAFIDGAIEMSGIGIVTECAVTWKGKGLAIQCTELRGHTTRHKSGDWTWADGDDHPERIGF